MEKYILDLGEKKIEIELVRTKVFCRYCSKVNPKCIKRHRSAVIWFIRTKVENSNTINSINYTVTDGEIPPELYENSLEFGIEEVYTTGGNWTVTKSISKVSDMEINDAINRIESEPTDYELKCLIHRLLGKHKHIEAPVSVPKFLILTILADHNISPKDITKPELSWLRKIYAKWTDDSTQYYGDIAIHRVPKSFREKIRFPVFGIELENSKYNTVVDNYNTNNAEVFKVYKKDTQSRSLMAVYVNYTVFKKSLFWYNIEDGEWHGMEKYFKHIHPECILHSICIFKTLHEMIHQRIGDLLFLDYLPKYPTNIIIRPAEEHQLKKIKLVNAKIEKEDNRILKIIPENNELPMTITHPEHGCLELYPQEHYVFQVPYKQRGHD